MNNLKLVESMITANDTNDLEKFTKEHKEKFSKLNVMEQSPEVKFQKDGAALHFLQKSLINLEKQMNICPARCKSFNSLAICYFVLQPEHLFI